MTIFERPSADVTSVEKMASQKSGSNIRLGECSSTISKGMGACQEGRFRRACRLVRRGLSHLQVRLWELPPSRRGIYPFSQFRNSAGG